MAIVWPPAWAPNGCAMWHVGHPTSLSPCLNGPPATSPREVEQPHAAHDLGDRAVVRPVTGARHRDGVASDRRCTVIDRARLVALRAQVALAEVHGLTRHEPEVHRVRRRECEVGVRVRRVDLVAGPAVRRRRVLDVGCRGLRAGSDALDEALMRVARGAIGGAPLEIAPGVVDRCLILELPREQSRVVRMALRAVLVCVLASRANGPSGSRGSRWACWARGSCWTCGSCGPLAACQHECQHRCPGQDRYSPPHGVSPCHVPPSKGRRAGPFGPYPLAVPGGLSRGLRSERPRSVYALRSFPDSVVRVNTDQWYLGRGYESTCTYCGLRLPHRGVNARTKPGHRRRISPAPVPRHAMRVGQGRRLRRRDVQGVTASRRSCSAGRPERRADCGSRGSCPR